MAFRRAIEGRLTPPKSRSLAGARGANGRQTPKGGEPSTMHNIGKHGATRGRQRFHSAQLFRRLAAATGIVALNMMMAGAAFGQTNWTGLTSNGWLTPGIGTTEFRRRASARKLLAPGTDCGRSLGGHSVLTGLQPGGHWNAAEPLRPPQRLIAHSGRNWRNSTNENWKIATD
jgi:hypothetical protein